MTVLQYQTLSLNTETMKHFFIAAILLIDFLFLRSFVEMSFFFIANRLVKLQSLPIKVIHPYSNALINHRN